MFGGDRDLDIICAVSTPPGVGGIHLLRVSGKGSLALIRTIAPFLSKEVESHRSYFGTLYWRDDQSKPIDEVLVTYFREGKSYTGEESVEISCHGSPFISTQIIKALIKEGARLADKGEFTYRAFLNGKMDLVQAEGVLALISSESEKANQIALRQLKGGLSKELKRLETDILALLARLEISIDFSAEDVEIISGFEVVRRVNLISESIIKLLSTFKVGNRVHAGFNAVLVGEPNVGKSSLLNCVLSEERAIVTSIPGTTRDLINEQLVLKGVKVNLIDSAGIRDTDDLIEKIGVGRTRQAIQNADLILFVYDMSAPDFSELGQNIPIDLEKLILVGNKFDLVGEAEILRAQNYLRQFLPLIDKFQNSSDFETFIRERSIFVSAHSEDSKRQILKVIEENLLIGSFGDEAVITQARHFENLQRSQECLSRTSDLANQGMSPEFLALELRESLVRIQEIIGERFDDQILDRIFSEFCIGK